MAKRSVCRAQIPSRRSKRRSASALLDAPRPCSTAQTQSSPANSWGMKRARTTRANTAAGIRDWANLGDGPAGVIAELVLAKDVADYIRFRAVCTAWRRCSPDPRSQRCFGDSRYHPRLWIMLDKAAAAHPRCHRFLNITTGECIRMDLPELEDHALLALTPEGLILLLDEPTRAVRLLNPLTRQLIKLPSVTTLPILEETNLNNIMVDGAGIVDASTVAVSFYSPCMLVVAKPGDERWTLVDSGRYFLSVLPFAGDFYCATTRGIEVLNASTDQQETPRLLKVITWGRSLRVSEMMNDTLHLVDNAGDLMLVHRMLRWCADIDDFERGWAVYKVDLHAGVLVPAKSLCRRAVFVGASRTVSVSVDAFDISADTLHFGYECGGDATYNLRSGEATYYRDCDYDYDCDCDETDEPCNHNMDFDWQGPLNIVSCLCDCIQGIGKELV